MIVAAADGSSLNNPGPSGWAWFINEDCWAADGWPDGTNNQGELRAVLDLLQQTAHAEEPLRVLCDSQYVINSVTRWLPGWKAKGWRKGDGKPVSNVELLKAIDTELQGREVHFEWVKGHAGHDMNEAADLRARAAASAVQQGQAVDRGPGFQLTAAKSRPQPAAVEELTQDADLFSLSDQEDQAITQPGESLPTASPTRPSTATAPSLTKASAEPAASAAQSSAGSASDLDAAKIRLAIIGAGNMGGAITRRAHAAGLVAAGSQVHDKHPAAAEQLAGDAGLTVASTNAQAVRGAQLVVLAIKPGDYAAALQEIAEVLEPEAVVLTISPAHSVGAVQELLGRDIPVARAMPNTPALVGKGTAGVCFSPSVDAQQRAMVMRLLGSLGLVVEMREEQFPALTGVAGSSPAYVYMMIEALAQGAIKGGIPAGDAYQLAASAVEGAAAMVRQTGKHPAQLRDEVCSAGGTTIAAVAALEKAGFPSAVIEAVDAAALRAIEMGS